MHDETARQILADSLCTKRHPNLHPGLTGRLIKEEPDWLSAPIFVASCTDCRQWVDNYYAQGVQEGREKITKRVEALYGGEPQPIWIEGTKIVRVTRRDRRLMCDITESMLKVEDVREAIHPGE